MPAISGSGGAGSGDKKRAKLKQDIAKRRTFFKEYPTSTNRFGDKQSPGKFNNKTKRTTGIPPRATLAAQLKTIAQNFGNPKPKKVTGRGTGGGVTRKTTK